MTTFSQRSFGTLVGALLMLAAAGVTGCGAPAPPVQEPPPPEVTVAHPIERDVVEWDTFTGHLQAPEVANVMARVSGLIVEMPFSEGAIVKRGDLLAVIDDRPFKADRDSKQADLKKAEAALEIARVTFERLQGLQKENAGAVSQQDVDNAKAVVRQAEAVVASSQAALENSRLNLEWCRVLSPIDGRISYKMVTIGNLVNGGAGQATLITTVQSVSPIYCYVDVDEHSVLKYEQLAAERRLLDARAGSMPCYVQLGNETGFPHKGVVDFVDNHVDPTTGTLRMRGVLKNESGLLIPGLFARLRLPGSGRYRALLAPETAIGNDQSERNVWVVDKSNKAALRPVKLGALFGDLRAIESGVTADDRIIINGQMRVRPGVTVKPIESTIKANAAVFTDPGAGVAAADPVVTRTVEPSADGDRSKYAAHRYSGHSPTGIR